MPQFRLEVIKENPKDRWIRQMLHCKKEYNERVKISNWEKYLQSRPIDINPYDPNCFRLHNSHYHRLGNQENKVLSENHDAFSISSIQSRKKYTSPEGLINFITFNDDFCTHNKRVYPKICVDEYLTTMQQSYQYPYPYEIKRLSMPLVQNENKKMASRNECKFLDDDFRSFSNVLHQNKGHHHISYNPFIGGYDTRDK
ncbi:uncharacterized protein LOC143202844 [Rhynchophorus ferrugineus]|uniref:uncharacterized protein LOC143202844 n=1 Tax=Rhynchophorus ferrugineus TaxID=354439 RepID=UPI003FCCBA3C